MVLTSKAGGKDPKPLDEAHRCDHRKGLKGVVHLFMWTQQFFRPWAHNQMMQSYECCGSSIYHFAAIPVKVQ